MAVEWKVKLVLVYYEKRMVILQLGEWVIAEIYGDSRAGRNRYRK